MPRLEEFQLHPLGWENDPEEERFKLSTLDYLCSMTWNNYVLFFRLDAAEKTKVEAVLKKGLERTLSQVRHLVGTVEKDDDGHHSFVRKRDSTVKFVVQHLDSPEDEFPSIAEIEKANFLTTKLGNIRVLSNMPMTYGITQAANPDNSPVITSFKANFIPGGLIFSMPILHYSNSVNGWASFTKQLADNCYAIINKTEFPSWDPECLDRSRFIAPPIPPESQAFAPPQAPCHPDLKPSQDYMFHIPKSKAAELKKAAWPGDGSWISTYDAVSALMWRVFSRVREPLYKLNPDTELIFIEGVNLVHRLTNPTLPARMQGNVCFVAVSSMSAVPSLTAAEVISEAPLSKLASYTRQMTTSITGDLVDGAVKMLAPIRKKQELCIRLDSFPPLTLGITDWRDADVCPADFGFGKPIAWRNLFDTVTANMVIVYPPRAGPAGDDEGIELHVAFEKELVQQLIDDTEWSKYVEYRGVDVAESVDYY